MGERAEGTGKREDFYAAVMDQDVRRIRDMCEKYGTESPVEVPGGLFCKPFWSFPLHVAASHRRLQSLQSLLSAGADAELRDQLGRNPLHLVLTSWPDAAAADTAAAGPNANSKFHSAVIDKCRQAEACLRLLCEHGVDVDAEMVEANGHQRALHVSVRRGALPAVRILAGHGADVHAVDSNGMTPLHVATGICHEDVVRSLISHRADVNRAARPSGNTPLHLAALAMTLRAPGRHRDRRGVVAALLRGGADPSVANGAGLTALQAACGAGAEEVVDLLLRHGADVNRRSAAGENCLFLFLDHRPNVRRSNSLLVKLLALTSPLAVRRRDGRLPAALTEACFTRQREQLLRLTEQPRRLEDICKAVVYLKYVQGQRSFVAKVLPGKLYDFVFHRWDNRHNIYFDTDKQEV